MRRAVVPSMPCILALALALLPGPTHAANKAEGSREQRCRYEYNRHPDCTKRERRRLNARFGMAPLEAMYRRQSKASDLIIASATFKLGGGLAMVLRKDDRGQPFAEIRRTPIGHKEPPPFRVKLSEEEWRTVTARSRTIDTNLYDDDSICTGGAAFTLQMIDDSGTYRARMGDVCSEHPGNWFFDDLAELTLAKLPVCASLAPEGYGEAWAGTKLYDCFMLDGVQDNSAAAYNFLEGTSFWTIWNSDEEGTRAQLAEGVVFKWPGLSLPANADDLASALTGERFDPFRLEATSYAGSEIGSVTVRGQVKVRNDDDDGPEYRTFGTFLSVWANQTDNGFRLVRFFVDRTWGATTPLSE